MENIVAYRIRDLCVFRIFRNNALSDFFLAILCSDLQRTSSLIISSKDIFDVFLQQSLQFGHVTGLNGLENCIQVVHYILDILDVIASGIIPTGFA